MEGGGRNKKICRICREGGGVCRQGLRKTHERADPACRFHGSDARGNEAVARGGATRSAGQAAPGGEGSGEVPARPRHVPFEQMTRFVTKGGIGLHYLVTFPDLSTNGHAEKLSAERGNGTTTKRVDPSTKLRRGSTHSIDRGSQQDAKRAGKLINLLRS